MDVRATTPIVVRTPLVVFSIATQNVRRSCSHPEHVEKLEEKWWAISPEEFPSGFNLVSTFLQNSYSSLEDEEDMEEFS